MLTKLIEWLKDALIINRTFPHDDPCFGCNRESCTKPTICGVIERGNVIDTEELF